MYLSPGPTFGDLDIPVQTCHDIKGTCLFNASAIHCPHKLNATCDDTRHYCCNMTLPPPRKSCSEVNGECHPDTQPYFCPHRVDAICPQAPDGVGQYCCGAGDGSEQLDKDSCSGAEGTCLMNSSRIFCPLKLDIACDDADTYCCKLNY